MSEKEQLNRILDHIDYRMNKLENKVEDLSRFKYIMFGGGLVSVFIINVILNLLTR